MNPPSPAATFLLFGYLAGDKNREKRAYLERLDQALVKKGGRLLLADLSGADIQSSCESIVVPKRASGPHFAPTAEENRFFGGVRFLAAVTREAAFRGIAWKEAFHRLAGFARFVFDILSRRQVDCLVAWNQFTGHSEVLTLIAKTLGKPVVYAHLGLLPGTIVFETGGQMAESWVCRQPEKFQSLPFSSRDRERTEAYLERVRQQLATRKPQPDTDPEGLLSRLRSKESSGRRRLFYAGHHDLCSGNYPFWAPEARWHAPLFPSTEDACLFLYGWAMTQSVSLLFKPHPSARWPEGLLPGGDEVLTCLPDANIFDCIHVADATATILSQVAYLALIQRRPVILLGRMPLSGHHCAYEALDLQSVPKVIGSALEGGMTGEQQEHFVDHCTRLMKHYLFAYDQTPVEFPERGTDASAAFLVDCLSSPDSAGLSRGPASSG